MWAGMIALFAGLELRILLSFKLLVLTALADFALSG